jgi:hypothetical protein
MTSHKLQQTLGGRSLGMETGDSIDHFSPFLLRFLDDDVTSSLKDLGQTGPITVAH